MGFSLLSVRMPSGTILSKSKQTRFLSVEKDRRLESLVDYFCVYHGGSG